jgi:hypothetical protein
MFGTSTTVYRSSQLSFPGASVQTTLGETAIWSVNMLQQLNSLALPTAISIASFDATFFIAAQIFGLTDREVLLGVIAGAVGGLTVLVAVLWQSARNSGRNVASQATN